MIRGIAFTGRMDSGKSTAATYVQRIIEEVRPVQRLAFACMLKQTAMASFGLSEDDCYTQEGKARFNTTFNMFNRELLQRLGEAMRQGICLDVWVKMLELEVLALEKNTIVPFWIIDDVRHSNEAAMVREHGGLVVRVVRDMSEPADPSKDHPSEVPLPEEAYDILLPNNDTKPKFLQDIVDKIIIPHCTEVWETCLNSYKKRVERAL